jgi:hypothetical protein
MNCGALNSFNGATSSSSTKTSTRSASLRENSTRGSRGQTDSSSNLLSAEDADSLRQSSTSVEVESL